MSSSSSKDTSIKTSSTSMSQYTTPPSSEVPTAASLAPLLPEPQCTPSNCASNRRTHQKRTHLEFSLPSDKSVQSNPSRKKAKVLFTTVSVKRSKEVENLHSFRMLQLARASREAFAAQAKHRLLRIRELDVMRTIAYDEYEEAQSMVMAANRQVGEVRCILADDGVPLFDEPPKLPLRLSPAPSCSDVSDPEFSDSSRNVSRSPSFLVHET